MQPNEVKVLVVDDEVDLAQLVSESFELEDFQVDVAYAGDKALELCQNDVYNVILSDAHMPGMTGMEFFSKVKELYAGKPFLFYLCTGDADFTSEEFQALGGTEVISKPYDLFSLIDQIKEKLA